MSVRPGYRVTETGDVPQDWELVGVGSSAIVKIAKAGGTPLRTRKEYYENGKIPFVRIEDITASEKYLRDTELKITEQGLDSSSTWIVPEDSILFSMYASFGEVVINKVPVATNQAIIAIVPSDKADTEFLYYSLKNLKPILRKYLRETTQKNLNGEIVKGVKIPLPDAPERRKIGSILSTIDISIQKTNEIIAKAEQLKNGLMQQLLTKGIGHARFKQTEIGEIPEHWNLTTLGKIVREPIRNGYSPLSPSEETGKKTLTLSAVSENGFRADRYKPAPLDDHKLDRCKLKDGDILVSRSNTRELVGLSGLYRGAPKDCYYPDLMMRVRLIEDRMSNVFVEYWLRTGFARKYLASRARGTSGSMVKINRKILSDLPIPMPQLDEQRDIVSRIEAVEAKIRTESNYKEELIRLKKGLMQVLLTGKVRVKVN